MLRILQSNICQARPGLKKILEILQFRVSPNVVDGGGGVIRHRHCLIGHSGDVVGAVRRASASLALALFFFFFLLADKV